MVAPHSFIFYRYDPSLAAAAAFVALFGLSAIAHTYQLIWKRTWYFIPFVIGGLCETVGYGGRIMSAQETPNWTTNPYILQSLLILVAPALFAASIYMVLGRIVRLVEGEHHSGIPIKWLTKIFVTADVISFCVQGAGGGLLAVAKDVQGFNNGQNVIIGGLFVQLAAFSVFVVVTSIFHRRMQKTPTVASQAVGVPWQRYLWVLYAASGLILVRSIFRVIEYLQGYSGSLQDAEYWLYIFDAVPMFVSTVVLNVFHPSKIISSKTKAGRVSLQSTTDIEQELQNVNWRASQRKPMTAESNV
ncbi:Uu.00g058280.m01.CDS01 [Anthostomella pinea]|uniref:Uu.00g058280.m01.CDS01 n=1 Tax=Anthostomella pinea TaxID=933095 RepID=A0AAI8VSP7_9PEZI|nr:Uu.00g058280.m01.CDS01 [Anthostomella pinea]